MDILVEGNAVEAIMDGGSTASLWGKRLHELLLSIGIQMVPYSCPLSLADHHDLELKALLAHVEIEIDGMICPHPMVVIPSFVDTPVLLGIDFLEKVGI